MSVPQFPRVSILLPTLNEQSFIRDAIDSLAAQDYPNIIELLVIDGNSTDETRTLAEAPVAIPVRIVDNPAVTAAGAMNRGLDEASGEVVVRVDAHSVYAPDFVRRSVEILIESGAANVGGPMRAVGTSRFGRAVATVTSSPFGVGPGRFHYATGQVEVETVYLGCWWTQTLRDIGGWDEDNLQWAAEDQELNFRLRQAGHRILLDDSIRSFYFPRDTAKSLRRQYFNYGMAKASTLAKHKTMPYWRPLVPAAMVAAAVVALVFPSRRLPVAARLIIPIGHLGASATLGARLARTPGVRAVDAWLVMLICHWWYGAGFWNGIARILTGRGFDTRPTGHR